jgi:hypothetical protein
MSEEQQQADALDAVTSALTDSSDALLDILDDERDRVVGDAPPGPVTSGLRLAHALGRLTDDQREALLLGAALSDQKHQLLDGLLGVLREKNATPPDH